MTALHGRFPSATQPSTCVLSGLTRVCPGPLEARHRVWSITCLAFVAVSRKQLVTDQIPAPSSKVGPALEIEIRSIAPSLAQSTVLQLASEELAPRLVGSERPVAGHR